MEAFIIILYDYYPSFQLVRCNAMCIITISSSLSATPIQDAKLTGPLIFDKKEKLDLVAGLVVD